MPFFSRVEETFSKLLTRVPWSTLNCILGGFSLQHGVCDTKSRYACLPNLKFVQFLGLEEILQSTFCDIFLGEESQVAFESEARSGSTMSDIPISASFIDEEMRRIMNNPSVSRPSIPTYVHSRAKGLISLGYIPPSMDEDAKVERQIKMREEYGAYVAASTMTTVVAAEKNVKQEAAEELQSLHSSPCEWFICDDPSTFTRCFIIQGSDSLASWQANLFFEPTKFEMFWFTRGIYEATKGIYEQFMPEILNHLRTYGDLAKIRFIGHSLGGSLSLLVNLMLLSRGVLESSTLLPVVTFGSPSVFCGGHRILEELGLDENHVHSVMMHRDIVPRAFSCNYPNHVAQVLKRLNGTFRSHPCLNKSKILYTPLGQLFILQLDEKLSPSHPLLALKAFLYFPHPLETLSDPTAYGSEGTILRDHDSSNYLKAMNGVLLQQTKMVVRKSRKEGLHQLWPLLTTSREIDNIWRIVIWSVKKLLRGHEFVIS
ncbi:hypothetical protein MKW92_030314 [Papaver armeniacum]|nr:hypothetical protein MKW92_030314 [Papaver armeniacum]